ncbi:hypothetical protein ILUMI_15080, partial [Ignelater luminosus]
MGNTKEIATKRFYSLENKLRRDPELKNSYSKFMTEYFELGHMSLIDENDRNKNVFRVYLPHHAVFKEDSETTKIR